MNDDINVLICDDSALMRNLISRIVDGTEGMTVVGKAMNGQFLVEKIPLLNPDVIILDPPRAGIHPDVADVILNRIDSPKFPDTVAGVLYQAGQFTCTTDGGCRRWPPTKEAFAAVTARNESRVKVMVDFE